MQIDVEIAWSANNADVAQLREGDPIKIMR